jgi:hypothetical protein
MEFVCLFVEEITLKILVHFVQQRGTEADVIKLVQFGSSVGGQAVVTSKFESPAKGATPRRVSFYKLRQSCLFCARLQQIDLATFVKLFLAWNAPNVQQV